MKEYLEYKDTGIGWIGMIPKSWGVKRIKNNTYVKGRIGWQGLSSDEYGDIGPYLVTGTDFLNGRINWLSCHHISDERYNEDPYIQLRKNDLLITKDGTIGKVALIDDLTDKVTLNSGVFVTRPLNDDYITPFMFWVLNSSVFEKFIDFTKTGSTVQHLYQRVFIEFAYPVPSLAEQCAIADFLDTKTAQIDILIAKKQRQIELLKEHRATLINQVVTKGLNPEAPMKDSGIEWLGKVPKHWEVKRIKHLLLPKKNAIKTGPFGSHLKNSDMGGSDIKVYNQRSVIDNDFTSGDFYISLEKFKHLKEFEIIAGDILITTRGTIGQCAIFPHDTERGVLHPCLIRLQVDENIVLKDFLILFVKDSVLFQESIFYESNATTIDVIYSSTLKQVLVPVPPTYEQKAIISYLKEMSSLLDKSTSSITKQISILREFRTALISAAVTGKIDVRGYKK